MKMSDMHMNAKELTNLLNAFVLALDEAIDYDRLQEATLRRLGAITEDQRAGIDAFFLELKNVLVTEENVDDTLTTLNAEEMMQELLDDDASDESKEDTAE